MAKAKIKGDGAGTVTCTFNPYEYTISKKNSIDEKSKKDSIASLELKKEGPQTLKLKLLFDGYDNKKSIVGDMQTLWKCMKPVPGKENKMSPRTVTFSWGPFEFKSIITNMKQKFILFDESGEPMRAEVTLTLMQHIDENDFPRTNPTSGGGPLQTTWPVKAGDRLDLISAEVYGDATQWRTIATYNGLTHPRDLQMGQVLGIPEL